mgnify:CR=1
MSVVEFRLLTARSNCTNRYTNRDTDAQTHTNEKEHIIGAAIGIGRYSKREKMQQMLPHLTIVVNVRQIHFGFSSDISRRVSTHHGVHQTQVLLILFHGKTYCDV